MRTDVKPLRPEDGLDRAMELFAESDLLALPVVDETSKRVVGVVKRHDVAGDYLRRLHEPKSVILPAARPPGAKKAALVSRDAERSASVERRSASRLTVQFLPREVCRVRISSLASPGVAAAVLSFVLPRPGPAADPARPPNIVFILADDLGYGDLGCYGQKRIQTPNLDRMAAEGMRFTQFYAGDTVCAPSRCCLMTGLHTGHATIRGNALVPLRRDDVTVAQLLKDGGYATGLVGKWGLGEPDTTGVPNRKGFDYFYGYLNQVHAHNYYPDYLWKNQEKVVDRGQRGQGRRGDEAVAVCARPAHEGGAGLRRAQPRQAVLPVPGLHHAACQRRARAPRRATAWKCRTTLPIRTNRGRRWRRTMRRWSRGSTPTWASS